MIKLNLTQFLIDDVCEGIEEAVVFFLDEHGNKVTIHLSMDSLLALKGPTND